MPDELKTISSFFVKIYRLQKQLIVIGGGAAGFFCAINAARLNPQLKVLLVEKTNKLLSKVKISGGGRCNLTHACFDIGDMSRHYPRGGSFVKKAFHHFFTTDTISWFEERGVQLKTEADGRMFPVTDSSQTIIDCLLKEAALYKVEIRMQSEVKAVQYREKMFELDISGNQPLRADYLCIACGGYPKKSLFEWLTALGHTIEDPVPSLFTFNLPGHPIRELMGVSVGNAGVKIAGTKLEQEGPLLITHWGLSGPAVLKLSAWGAKELGKRNYHFSIALNWLPGTHEQQLAERFQSLRMELGPQKMSTKNPFGLPNRLWDFLLAASEIGGERRWADLSSKEANRLIQHLCRYTLDVKGKTTFKEEFVTAGGIRLSEIGHADMMCKKIPGLYFAGEIMDVDGVTGGFNFQHAWTSGFIAGQSIANAATNSQA